MNILKWFYHRRFRVEDFTKGMNTWFGENGRIVSDSNSNILEGYTGGYTNAVYPKNWKEVNKTLEAMKSHGCKNVSVVVYVSYLGKRRRDIAYEFDFESEGNDE